MTGYPSRKKILVFADWYEPGYKAGGPIQSVKNFVAGMQDLYDISVFTSDTDLGEKTPYPGIVVDQWIGNGSGTRLYYASRKSLGASALQKMIDSENPDFIYLNSLYSVRFSIIPLYLLWKKKISPVYILSPRGMLRESAIRIKTKRKKLFIALLNRMGIPEKIRFHATDAQEKKDILFYFPGVRKLEMLSNFSAPLPESLTAIKKIPGRIRLVFISRIMDIKNILFFLNLLKQITEIELEFSIYGEIEDAAYWQKCLAVKDSLPPNIKAVYFGPLEHARVLAALEASHVFVLPTRGENFGHAIFESLSAGRPVLISDKTPWLGLREKQIGWDLSLDRPEQWTAAVREAAAFGQAEFDRWMESSRQFAKNYMERSDLKKGYLALFS